MMVPRLVFSVFFLCLRTFARKLSVVFPGAFVPTDHTLNILIFVSTTGAVLRRSLTTQKRQITSWCI